MTIFASHYERNSSDASHCRLFYFSNGTTIKEAINYFEVCLEMSQAIVKIEYLFKNHVLAFVLISLLFSIAIAGLLYISLIIVKPPDIATHIRWDTPTDIYPYRKNWIMLLSSGGIFLLILGLFTSIFTPVYLSKRIKINRYFNRLKQCLFGNSKYTSTISYLFLLTTFSWLVISTLFLSETLIKMYPPTLIELVQQSNGLETAEHWADYIYFLFCMFISLGTALILGPFGVTCYLLFKTKGRV